MVILNKSEAAEYLGISRPTLDRHIRDGLVPFIRLHEHGRILFSRDSLDELLRANERRRTTNGTKTNSG